MYLSNKLFRSHQPSLNLNLPQASAQQETLVCFNVFVSPPVRPHIPCHRPEFKFNFAPPGSRGGGHNRERHPQRRQRGHRLQRFGPAAKRHAKSPGPGRYTLHPLQRQVRLHRFIDLKTFLKYVHDWPRNNYLSAQVQTVLNLMPRCLQLHTSD